VTYDHLILATGARPRELDCPCDFAGQVLVLRGRADAARLKAALAPGHRLAVIGAGYIGLEVAASAQASGAVCTVIEREERVMPRVASAIVSAFFQWQHAAQGVRVIVGAGVEALESAGVRLRDGRLIACDTVLVGTGAMAEDRLAHAAGLDCENGIVVGETARSSDPRIYAIGDCTCRVLPLYGKRVRLESVANAVEQAKQAAAALCGRKPPAHEVPWFWSDQYELRLQIAGLPFGVDRTVVRGDPESGSFAVFHLGAEGTVQAVETVNAAPEFMAGRMLISRRRAVTVERLADPACPMQAVVA
jgi:3-phenylpropionate/trans-cinnamate dioxygenase ferredoxin reductase subunit